MFSPESLPLFLVLGTSKFFIVPSGLGDLWMSWDDLFFGSPFVPQGAIPDQYEKGDGLSRQVLTTRQSESQW